MRQKILQLTKHEYARTTFKYGIVSVIATVIDFAVLNGGITLAHLNPQLSKTAAFLTATIATFPMQQKWVFTSGGAAAPTSAKQWIQYLGASIAGYLASIGLITVANIAWPGNVIAINVANLAGFGSVWVFKLVFFQKVVFAAKEAEGITEVDDIVVDGAKSPSGESDLAAAAES